MNAILRLTVTATLILDSGVNAAAGFDLTRSLSCIGLKGANESKCVITTSRSGRRTKEIHSTGSCANVSYGSLQEGRQPIDLFEETEEIPRFVSPPNLNGTTLVDMGLFITHVTAIDESSDSFSVEGFLDLIWCDPRLAYGADSVEIGEEIFLEHDVELALDRIWWPDATFVNEARSRDVENLELEIFPDGTLEYKEKFGAVMNTRYDITKFPFDHQVLMVEIESFAWSEEFLLFHINEEKVGFGKDFHIAEWLTMGVETHLEHKQEIRDRAPFHEFVMEIYVKRQPQYYIWKVLLPLLVLSAVSAAVFWMEPEDLSARRSVSITALLSMLAFQFVIADDLARVPYFTYSDFLLVFCFVLTGVTIVVNVYVNLLCRHDQSTRAHETDRTCRWAFPISYVLGLTIGSLSYLVETTVPGVYLILLLVLPISWIIARYCRSRERHRSETLNPEQLTSSAEHSLSTAADGNKIDEVVSLKANERTSEFFEKPLVLTDSLSGEP